MFSHVILSIVMFSTDTNVSGGSCSGWRMQLHRRGEQVQFWSRNGVEHGQYSGYSILAAFVLPQVQADEVILDGELVVWNIKRLAWL
jgi:hypothetical protein